MPVVPIRWVLVRDPFGRFEPQALLCTDPARDPVQILRWFVQRWQLEVTFREVRDHLGVETQRQWSDQAIARTTPCLLGLFSLVTLLAAQLTPQARQAVATSAWYRKRCPTFSDYACCRAPRVLAGTGFRHLPPSIEHSETPTGTPRGHHIRALQCRLMAKAKLSSNSSIWVEDVPLGGKRGRTALA